MTVCRAAFEPPDRLLRCVGECDGGPWPRGFVVDLGSRRAADKLRYLELDHEHDLQVTCDLWRRQLPADFTSWWDRVRDPSMLCHLLFGVLANAVHRAERALPLRRLPRS